MNINPASERILSRLRGQSGESITDEQLFDLHDALLGEAPLTESERDGLLARVAIDPEAASKLRELMRFPRADSSGGQEDDGAETARRWRRLVEQLDSQSRHSTEVGAPKPFRGESGSAPRRRRRLQGFALAASFLMAAGLALVLGRSWEPGPTPEPERISVNAAIVELTETPHRGSTRVEWPRTSPSLVIVLSAPDLPVDHSFEVLVLDGDGDAVLRSQGLQGDDVGRFFVTLHRPGLPTGAYEIQIRGASGEVKASFSLQLFEGS